MAVRSAASRMKTMSKVGKFMHELKADNKKKGKAKGAGGKVRPRKQMIAIALSKAGVAKNPAKKASKKR